MYCTASVAREKHILANPELKIYANPNPKGSGMTVLWFYDKTSKPILQSKYMQYPAMLSTPVCVCAAVSAFL